MALPSNNNTIPAELQEQIKKDADEYVKHACYQHEIVIGRFSFIAGAESNAIWKVKYDELKAENERLNDQNGRIHEKNKKVSTEYTTLKAQAQRMVDALGEIIKRSNAGKTLKHVDSDVAAYARKAISEWNREKEGGG